MERRWRRRKRNCAVQPQFYGDGLCGIGGSRSGEDGGWVAHAGYEQQLPQMLKTVDETLRSDPHYLGWALHSWNDQVGK